MINFCSSSLKPNVATDTISSDGYEVTNLISNDPSKKKMGFMAYHTIKPPVSTTFNLFCDVNISHLILWAQVGCQKSTGFEILAKRSKISIKGNNQHRRIALGDVEENSIGIIFYRKICSPSYLKSTEHLRGFTRRTLFEDEYLVNNIASLQIKIIKTNGCVPALARVEVWGYPSKSYSQKRCEKIYKMWKSEPKKSLPSLYRALPENQSKFSENQENIVSLKNSDFVIPDEFLDSITCSLMVLPMILPCGKVVDQSTLEKHKESEANWGRGPSDPFTGRLFTEKCQPVLATALKARIDKFLVDHSENEELWTVPRTVGKKTQSSNDCSRSSVNDSCASTSNEQKNFVNYNLSASCSYNLPKRKMDTKEDTVKRKKLISTKEKSNTSKGNVDNHLTLEDEDDISLISALRSTLAGLPRYTNFNDSSDDSSNDFEEICCKCKSDKMLFKLPCSHLICRNCLVFKRQSDQLLCDLCKKSFLTSDPLRYHK